MSPDYIVVTKYSGANGGKAVVIQEITAATADDAEAQVASEGDLYARVLPGANTPCTAKLYHGPGHQSKSRCEKLGPHEVHETHYMGQRARWRDGQYTGKLRAQGIDFDPDSYPENMGMTGFFDEPPEEDE